MYCYSHFFILVPLKRFLSPLCVMEKMLLLWIRAVCLLQRSLVAFGVPAEQQGDRLLLANGTHPGLGSSYFFKTPVVRFSAEDVSL